MPRWWLVGIRNWWVKPGRTATAALAIALGVGTVIWVMSANQSVRSAVEDQVVAWVGKSQISVEPPFLGRISAKLIEPIRQHPAVADAAARVKYAWWAVPPDQSAGESAPEEGLEAIDILGIDPTHEYALRTFRGAAGPLSDTPDPSHGRLLQPNEPDACMIEDSLAREWNLRVGDTLAVTWTPGGRIYRFAIVGRFVQRRVAKFQRPNVVIDLAVAQQRGELVNQVQIIDVILKDGSLEGLRSATSELESLVKELGQNALVRSAESRLQQLTNARNQSDFFLMLISSVALLTSLFIVVTTMSMGMVERLTQLGMMRCLGYTRGQIALATLAEIVPMGLIGVLAGVPLGIALTQLSVSLAPEYLHELVISRRGLWVGLVGGFITSVGSGLVPAIQLLRISPLAATRPHSSDPPRTLEFWAAALGVILLAIHQTAIGKMPGDWWFIKRINAAMTFSLFLGYALLTPFLIRTLGQVLAMVAAGILGIRRKLLQDQITSAPWRSGVICTGFMVTLALVVGVGVHSEGVLAGWSFPTEIPEAFIWMSRGVPAERLAAVRALPQVRDLICVNNFVCQVDAEKRTGIAILRIPSSMFVAVDMEPFLRLTKLEYRSGDPETARSQLLSGGHVLLTVEGANQLGLKVGDEVPVRYGWRKATFIVAGIVESPSLDIAAKYFQAEHQLLRASASTLIGTFEDARKYFQEDTIYLALLNLSPLLQETPAPELFSQAELPKKISHEYFAPEFLKWAKQLSRHQAEIPALTPSVQSWWSIIEKAPPQPPLPPHNLLPFTRALRHTREYWQDMKPEQRWRYYQDQVVLQQAIQQMGDPSNVSGSIRLLKEDIDNELRQAMRLITTIPIIGLIVAAIGAGNLMMANVAVRIRQIALLRAIGATQWQVIRLVLAEALILGLLGTGLGLILGLHAAHSSNTATFQIWGFQPPWAIPWELVSGALLITLGTCLVAGLFPGRFAARSNIIAAMSIN
ncbi:MAG: hypothetical protein HJJLKODD_01272 [Phycisphaerae bacterium]|nr:hypothetical protein [Phycisphaerae bacterium]